MPWRDREALPGFRPDRPHGTAIEQTRRVGWPVKRDGNVPARGMLFDSDGRPITGTVQAGKGPADRAQGLKEPWAADERMTTRFHLEGHAAAVMRQHDLEHAVLYVNIPPCGWANRDPWRCDQNLNKLLHPGTTLTVWVAQQDGNIDRFKYRGTGEALK